MRFLRGLDLCLICTYRFSYRLILGWDWGGLRGFESSFGWGLNGIFEGDFKGNFEVLV